MTDTNNTAASTEAKAEESKAKNVRDNMASRLFFDNAEEAATYIEKCRADFADFDSYPVAAAGFTDEGDFDPEIYTDEMRICVAKLTQRGEDAGSKSTVKAIVIYPSPKLSAILGIDADTIPAGSGLDWLTAIVEKELNHVAVRNLRKADDGADGMSLADAVESMPLTVSAYLTSSRETAGGVLETYNDTWQQVKKAMAQKFKAFALAPLSKKELRKAIESASYAASVYPILELRKTKNGETQSLFEIAATFGTLVAKESGLDPAFYENALANRNETTIAIAEDDEDFDLEAMAKAITKPTDAAAETPTTGSDETQDGEGDA